MEGNEEWGSSVRVAKAEGLGARVRFEGVGGDED